MNKKILIRGVSFLLSASVLFGLSACGNSNNGGSGNGDMERINAENNNYEAATVYQTEGNNAISFDILGGEEVMPIGVFYGPYGTSSSVSENGVVTPDYLTDEIFTLLKDSGVNYIGHSQDQWSTSKNNVIKALSLCEEYGLGYFVNDATLVSVETAEAMTEKIKDYIDLPNVLGVHMRDEPKLEDSEQYKRAVAAFGESVKGKKKYAYINLLPSYTNGTDLGGTHYNYMSTYAKDVNLPFVSYDNYPFTKKDQGTTSAIPNSYFNDLSTARKVADENGKPFWVYVQAGGQWEPKIGVASDPLFPNEGETLWNVNTSLAYGATSIQYFPFIQPVQFSDAGEDGRDYTRNGMIGVAGNVNRWYYYVQKANKQIAAIDHILMKSVSEGVIATGYWKDRISAEDKPDANSDYWRELKGVTSSGSTGVIIGCFDYNYTGDNSHSAFYVVNGSSTEKQTVTLTFDKKYGFDFIQRAETFGVAGKTIKITLEGGEGVMLALR